MHYHSGTVDDSSLLEFDVVLTADELHVPAALPLGGKRFRHPLNRRMGGPLRLSGQFKAEKSHERKLYSFDRTCGPGSVVGIATGYGDRMVVWAG